MNKLKPHVTPISLGWNCHVALFIQELGDSEHKFYERQVFDWLGIPMWSINRLIENNFDKLLDKDLIIPRKRYTYKNDKIYSHTLYDIRFLHDFAKNMSNYTEFQEKYNRRIERFWNILNSGQELLFFRLEQDHYNRIQYEEFKQEEDEKAHLEKFADTLRNKNVKYTIIYFTTSSPKYFDKERRIIYVQFAKKDPKIEIGVDQIKAIFNQM